MKTLNITSLLKALRPASAIYQQLELPLSGRGLTRREETSLLRLRKLRERVAML
ncbi:MAG: hypothetical protein WA771_05920 [Chthoniobacterales bacterium]